MTTFPPHQAPDFPQADTVANPTVRQGDQGAAVVKLQRLLNNRGATLVVDGIFGAVTDAAVRRFQQENRLVVDGIVGARTWAALRSTPASSIRLVDVVAFYDPANHPHQRSALIWLQTQIPLQTLMEFGSCPFLVKQLKD